MYKHRVATWMSTPPILASPATSLADAQHLMDEHDIRHLAVVRDGRLVGIITRGDLRQAQPWHVTTLSVYEWRALLGRATIADYMTHNPVTTTPDAPVLEAAEQMLRHKIGALPVVVGEEIVGVISETDLLRLLIADETRLEELALGEG
jgi:CBS domain-containing protein